MPRPPGTLPPGPVAPVRSLPAAPSASGPSCPRGQAPPRGTKSGRTAREAQAGTEGDPTGTVHRAIAGTQLTDQRACMYTGRRAVFRQAWSDDVVAWFRCSHHVRCPFLFSKLLCDERRIQRRCIRGALGRSTRRIGRRRHRRSIGDADVGVFLQRERELARGGPVPACAGQRIPPQPPPCGRVGVGTYL